MEPLAEYDALVAKVTEFGARVGGSRAADMACRAGCDGCCHVELSVSAVEAAAVARGLSALPETVSREVAARARLKGSEPRCVMLDAQGQCSVYSVRPLVCRTQGLPLRYSAGVIPPEAVMAKGSRGGDLTWCPLNFTVRPPGAPDVLDAERVDAMLALVNRRFSEARGEDALSRVTLRALAKSVTGAAQANS